MKALVAYDSKLDHTERLARTIAETLTAGEPAVVPVPASTARPRDLIGIDLLAVGGPTQGHGLSPVLKAFLESLPPEAVRDLPTVTFDTRLPWPRFLCGSAAVASARRLTRKGARLLLPPESFKVSGSGGPLAEGELARATTWATEVRAAAGHSAQQPAAAVP